MNESVRLAVRNAISQKRVPDFNIARIGDLAAKLGMSFPVSISDLLRTLNELLPAGVTYDSGRIATGTVHASAVLYLQSDGGVAFIGQAHESGLAGQYFTMAMALFDVKDYASGGGSIVFEMSGFLGGNNDKKWQVFGYNPYIELEWESVKRTRVETRLYVGREPLELPHEVLAAGFQIAAAAFGYILDVCPEGQSWQCGVRPIGSPNDTTLTVGDPQNPGVGAEYYCRCA